MSQCLASQQEEMAQEKQFANFYGLIRLKFGTGRMSRMKYVFVAASRVDEEDGEAAGRQSAVAHGKAMAQRGLMEKAIQNYANCTSRIEITRLSDLCIENVVEQVKKSSQADADIVTVESYQTGLAEHLKNHPSQVVTKPEEADVKDDKALTAACVAEVFQKEFVPEAEVKDEEAKMEQVESDGEGDAHEFPGDKEDKTEEKKEAPTPAPEAAGAISGAIEEAAPETAAAAKAEAASKEAEEKAKEEEKPKYSVGDLVFVYSNATKSWVDDGIALEILEKQESRDGLDLPAGSVKVQYNSRKLFKWVNPAQMQGYLRKSLRPRPPNAVTGEMLKETHNWVSTWHVRYFELCRGYFQWWQTADHAKTGAPPNGSLALTGLEMTRPLPGNILYLRTSNSKGRVYAYDATTDASATKWNEMLLKHQQYCLEMHKYLSDQANNLEKHLQEGKEETLEKASGAAGLVTSQKRRVSVGTAPDLSKLQ